MVIKIYTFSTTGFEKGMDRLSHLPRATVTSSSYQAKRHLWNRPLNTTPTRLGISAHTHTLTTMRLHRNRIPACCCCCCWRVLERTCARIGRCWQCQSCMWCVNVDRVPQGSPLEGRSLPITATKRWQVTARHLALKVYNIFPSLYSVTWGVSSSIRLSVGNIYSCSISNPNVFVRKRMLRSPQLLFINKPLYLLVDRRPFYNQLHLSHQLLFACATLRDRH